MSAEDTNTAILERARQQFNDTQARQAYLDLYDAKCTIHGPPGIPPGIDSIRQYYAALWAAFPDAHLTFEDVIARGDRVAVRFSFSATHEAEFNGIPRTGKRVALTGITILRFAGGKCVERWNQADFLGLLQQLGAIPAPGAGAG